MLGLVSLSVLHYDTPNAKSHCAVQRTAHCAVSFYYRTRQKGDSRVSRLTRLPDFRLIHGDAASRPASCRPARPPTMCHRIICGSEPTQNLLPPPEASPTDAAEPTSPIVKPLQPHTAHANVPVLLPAPLPCAPPGPLLSQTHAIL